LNLDPKILKKLIELAYLGEWMINARHGDDFQDEEATAALQALLAASGAEGVDQDPETGEFYLDPDWVEKLYSHYVSDYEDHVFWDSAGRRDRPRG
jgi:DNA mismatch repair protein MutH